MFGHKIDLWQFAPGLGGGAGYASQSKAFFARLATQPSAAKKARYDTLIKALIASGAWSKLDVLHIYCADDSPTALTNLVQSNYGGVVNGTMTFSANHGFTGNGSTGYIDTQFVPSSAGGSFAQNDNNFGVYILTARVAGQPYAAIGSNTAAVNSDTYIYPWYVDNNSYAADEGIVVNTPATAVAGMWLLSRTGSGVAQEYLNGSPFQAVNGASAGALPSLSFVVGARRAGAAGAPSDFSADQFAAIVIGGGLSSAQVAQVSNAINGFLAGAGVNVFAATSNFPALSSAALSSIFSGASTLPAFGVTTHQRTRQVDKAIPDATNAALAQQIGATAVRIDCDWQDIEQVAGVYDFSRLDPCVTALRGAGMTVQMVCGYGNTLYGPSFYTGPADATARAHYNNWLVAVANHYGSTGFIYQLWNEPNLGAGDYAWAPSPNAADYTALMSSAAAALKAAKPAAIVLTGGVAPGTGIAPTTFISTVAAGTLTNIDGFGYHPYNSGTVTGARPEQMITDTAAFVSADGSAKPTYWDEIGYSLDWTANSETVKATYVVRMMLSAAVSQVKQCIVFDLIDDGTDPADHESNFGLFSYSFQPLPAATAYAAIIAALSGMTSNDAAQITTSYLRALTIHKISSLVRIVWAAAGAWRYTSVEGAGKTGSAVDVFGAVIPISNDGLGNLTFNVVDAGGPVILTVQ